MRASLLALVLVSFSSLAQPVDGVWTGYVGGWAPNRSPVRVGWGVRVPPRLTASQYQQYVLAASISQLANQQAYWQQMNFVERQQEAERLDREALARRAAEVAERDQALSQRQLEQAYVVAEQQRRIAELERRQYEALQREAAEAQAQLSQARAALEAKALEEREKEIAAREAARVERAKEDDRKGVKTNVYRWVDEDGVMHFSTKPRR